MTPIMRGDLCGISQLLPFLTIKWDIPADPLIEALSELRIHNFSAFDCCRQLVAFFLSLCHFARSALFIDSSV